MYLIKPFLGPIFKILQSSQLYNSITRLSEKKNYDLKVSDYTEHQNIYIENIISMSIFCDGLNAKYLNILHPHVIFKDKKHERENKFTLLNYRSEIVKKLYMEIKNIAKSDKILVNNFLDSTNIFDNNDEHIFSDDVHFMRDTNRGYYILAEFISDIITN